MAKVDTPSETLENFKTIANVFTLRIRKEGNVINRMGLTKKRTASSQDLVNDIEEAYSKEWQSLTDGEREDWNILGAEIFTTGFKLFMRESFKESTQSVYDYAVYNQNVYMVN